MPITITPNSSAYPGDSDVRVDGEVASASFLNSETLQPYLNGIAAARTGLYGRGTRRRYSCTTSNTSITINPLGAITLTSNGGSIWHTVFHGVTTVLGVFGNFLDSGVPANHTRYFIYATTNGSAVNFVISTIIPDATLSYQSATTDWFYVGTFVTNGSAVIKEFTCSGGRYMYHISTGNNTATLPGLSLGNATFSTLVNFDSVSNRGIPDYADFAIVQCSFTISAGVDLAAGAAAFLIHPEYPAILASPHIQLETIGSYRNSGNTADRISRLSLTQEVMVRFSQIRYRVNDPGVQLTMFAVGFLDG